MKTILYINNIKWKTLYNIMNNIIIPANSIAVLLLENTSIFLYPAVCAYESEEELILECAIYYDYHNSYIH